METPTPHPAEFDPSARLDVPTGFEQNESGLLMPATVNSVSSTERAALTAGMEEGRGSFRFNDTGERAENDTLNTIERELQNGETMRSLRDFVDTQLAISTAQFELNKDTDSLFGDTNTEKAPTRDDVITIAVTRFNKKMLGGDEGVANAEEGSEDYQHELSDQMSKLADILSMDTESFEAAYAEPVEVSEVEEPAAAEIEYDENGLDADGYDREGYSVKGFTRTGKQRKRDPNVAVRGMKDSIFDTAEPGWVTAGNPDVVPVRVEADPDAKPVAVDSDDGTPKQVSADPGYGYRNNDQGIPVFDAELAAQDKKDAEEKAKKPAPYRPKPGSAEWIRAHNPNARVYRADKSSDSDAEKLDTEPLSVPSVIGRQLVASSVDHDAAMAWYLGLSDEERLAADAEPQLIAA